MKIRCLFFFLLVSMTLSAQDYLSALLPMPNRVEPGWGEDFIVTPKTVVTVDSDSLAFAASELRRILQERTGLSVTGTAGEGSVISLQVDPAMEGKEHYILSVERDRVVIKGATPGAVYWGIMTLDQLLLGDVCRSAGARIAPVYIDDAPRFAYRALMLDPARHFLPVKDVKFFIDQMVRYKYNVLQLHLTDDQGWRVEIRKYPALTAVGANRNPQGGNEGPDNGFYTQEELKELVRYAAERNVEIVPELDIPGHTVAVLAAFPELGCPHTESVQKVMGETVNLMLCAGNDKVYKLYEDIIQEVAAIFPSKRIHLGGDEAIIEENWMRCERCRALMKEKGYAKVSELMGYFFGRILPYVRDNGKEAILWCELDNIRMPVSGYLFPYPQDVTLVTWRYGLTPFCMDLTLQHGHQLIMASGEYAYLDYPQWPGDLPEFNNWGMPVTSLETCYRFDPGYGRPATEQNHILGIMGTLWGEAIKDINRVTYMTYPRALALAEAGWTRMEFRKWDSFRERLYPNLMNLMRHGVSVRAPFEIGR